MLKKTGRIQGGEGLSITKALFRYLIDSKDLTVGTTTFCII